MLAVEFLEANKVFGKPKDQTDEQCSDLSVWVGTSIIEGDPEQTKIPVIISKWQLSKEDLEMIQQTGCVWLSITGHGMPPVSLQVEYPFIIPTFKPENDGN